jgi:hypothetical protein
MLVQLTPWETTTTSVSLRNRSSLRRRRRKRSGSEGGGGGEDEENDDLPNTAVDETSTTSRFAGSFLATPSRNSLRKMRVHSKELSDFIPVLAVTSEHRIVAVGRKLGKHHHQQQQPEEERQQHQQQSHQQKHQQLQGEEKQNHDKNSTSSSYREYGGCFQYRSRPGGAGSFFAKPKNGMHHPADLPAIPAILDTKNDRVYALQRGNSRLCCWNTWTWTNAGVDDKDTIRVELSSPVLSMTLLPMHRGMVYGTCLNGDIFVATVVIGGDTTSRGKSSGDESIVVRYLPARQPNGTVHIGTLAELPEVAHQTKSSGRKRKMSDADGNVPVVFYQTFCDGTALNIVRHEIIFHGVIGASAPGSSPRDIFKRESLVQRIASFDVLRAFDPSCASCGGLALTRAELLISSSGTAPKVSLVFTVGTRSTNSVTEEQGCLDYRFGTYCATLSMATADFSCSPVRLPSRAVQFGLVTESSLAVATNDEVCLFDLTTGSLLQSKSLKRLARDEGSDWVLCTDTKHATIAVLYSKDDQLNVAFCTALDDDRRNLVAEPINAASKLACSLLNASKKQNDRRALENSHSIAPPVTVFGERRAKLSFNKLEMSQDRMLEMLVQCGRQTNHVNRIADLDYLDVFQSCVSTLVSEADGKQVVAEKGPKTPVVQKTYEISHRNPQDSANEFSEINGSPLQSPKTVITKLGTDKEQLNGWHNGPPMAAKKLTLYDKLPACLPQSFIDGALDITLSVIRCEPKPERSRHILQARSMEARSVLKQLLLSHRVSARVHFEGSDVLQESSKKHPLVLALHSLEMPKRFVTYSPVNFIHDLLQCCSDLSERQLVILLNYMLRNATVHDIAESFVSTKDWPERHQYKRLGRRYFNARAGRARLGARKDSEDDVKSNADELKTVSTTLLLTGATVVLQKIVYYSECNDAMLRVALREGLSSSAEAALLARLLSDMLLSPPFKIASHHKRHKNLTKVLCQWAAALCEGCRTDLEKATTGSGGETYLSFLINSVSRVTRNAQATMALKDDIGFAHTKRREMEREARKLAVIDSKTAHFAEKPVKEEEIPGYSIEKLWF